MESPSEQEAEDVGAAMAVHGPPAADDDVGVVDKHDLAHAVRGFSLPAEQNASANRQTVILVTDGLCNCSSGLYSYGLYSDGL